MKNESELEDRLSEPTPEVVESVARLDGDFILLGVAGKMGVSLARMVRRALDRSGRRGRVTGVARFSDPSLREKLESAGIGTLAGDLMDRSFLELLPEARNVIYMVGVKFGSTGNEPFTWASNAYLPALVAEKFRASRLAAFSTGNVYPFVPVDSGGSRETDPTGPVGEYAQSCLGRERVFQYFCGRYQTPAVILRLNYAIDLRYGVLLDIAQRVFRGEPLDLATGHVNFIWQGDANAFTIRSLEIAEVPPRLLNLTGPGTFRVRDLAEAFGREFQRQPVFSGVESGTALLADAGQCRELFGPPRVEVETMVAWVAEWVRSGGPTWKKPTHFDTRDGKF
ncbi:MAG TPA: epimerase [bacterium]|nr:epimerase [bacterium]HNS48041.1 epimerase [bacterium]